MTRPAPTPMTEAAALLHLRDALGENYSGPTDPDTLKRALELEQSGEQFRPWATAKRLIKFNTEYEVGGELRARIDRKLAELDELQREADDKWTVATTGNGPMLITWGNR